MSYEYHTDKTDPVLGGYWLDCLVYGRKVEHVVEWKNLQLDFLFVPGISTTLQICFHFLTPL